MSSKQRKISTGNVANDLKNEIYQFEKKTNINLLHKVETVSCNILATIPLDAALKVVNVCWAHGFNPPVVEFKVGEMHPLTDDLDVESVMRISLLDLPVLTNALQKSCFLASEFLRDKSERLV